jgi:hydroxyacylglutathione hydrolase
MILVKTFYAYNDLRNYSFLITDGQTGSCWAIDPYEALPMIEYIKKNHLSLKGILNTHQHFDHIRGNAPLVDSFKAKVCKLKDSETIHLSDAYSLSTMDTPGHTLDHQVFLWKKDNDPLAVFSGDTLFNSGVGNCRGGGDVNLLYATTHKLLSELPEATLLYPGHDYRKRNLEFALQVEPENPHIQNELYRLRNHSTEDLPPSTIGEEKMVNPFLRLDSQEIRESIGKTNVNEKDVFIQLRSLRDQW